MTPPSAASLSCCEISTVEAAMMITESAERSILGSIASNATFERNAECRGRARRRVFWGAVLASSTARRTRCQFNQLINRPRANRANQQLAKNQFNQPTRPALRCLCNGQELLERVYFALYLPVAVARQKCHGAYRRE